MSNTLVSINLNEDNARNWFVTRISSMIEDYEVARSAEREAYRKRYAEAKWWVKYFLMLNPARHDEHMNYVFSPRSRLDALLELFKNERASEAQLSLNDFLWIAGRT